MGNIERSECHRCGSPEGKSRFAGAIYLCDDCEIETRVPEVKELRQQLREAGEAELRAIVEQAKDGDEWVSGHDLAVRVGAIVLDRLGGQS